MAIEQIIPQLLDQHVHLDRWQRPAELVRLVAVWTPWPPAPVEISRADLRAALDRDDEQAKYDHRVMVRLAERDRVLIRKRGHPDAWRLDTKSASTGHWRNVPWRTSRTAFGRDVAHFLRLDAGKPRPIGGERAGQSGQTGVITPPTDTQPPNNASAIDHPLLAGSYPQTASPPGKTPGQSPPNGQEGGAASQLSENYTPSLPTPPQKPGREGAPLSLLGAQLVQTVADTIHCPVIGTPAQRIAALIDAQPERLSEIFGAAGRLGGIRTAAGAAQALEAALVQRPSLTRNPCSRCGGSGRYIEQGFDIVCNHLEAPA